MINNSIIFFLKYCIYPRTLLFLVLIMPTKSTKLISIAIYQDIFSNQILKKSSAIKIDDFLKKSEKILEKKKMVDQCI